MLVVRKEPDIGVEAALLALMVKTICDVWPVTGSVCVPLAIVI